MSEKSAAGELVLVIASRIKDLNKEAGYATGADFLEALSAEVGRLVSRAQQRAAANSRKTLKQQDL